MAKSSQKYSSNLVTDSAAAWWRLGAALLLGTIGCIGMWSFIVSLPLVQAEFGVARADAALPYTFVMLGFGFGGVAMGRLADRFGIVVPLMIGAVATAAGYFGAALAPNLWLLASAHFVMGTGASASFGPLMADISHWFVKRRGIAVSIVATSNYLAGAIWPPVVQHFNAMSGWRETHVGLGVFCLVTMFPLAFAFRRLPPVQHEGSLAIASAGVPTTFGTTIYGKTHNTALGLSPNALQILLCVAGVSCCVAMAMPQVHIVAYCGDLGYGVARGADMLALMLGCGIISRIGSGFLADRIGGVPTLLIGSVLQGVALALYLGADGLTSLYIVSALFGLFQGGLVSSYPIIVREYFPPREAGLRVGLVLMATVVGMALGGWMSGLIFDLTGSYRAAFLNGIAWNILNVAIAAWLLMRPGRRVVTA